MSYTEIIDFWKSDEPKYKEIAKIARRILLRKIGAEGITSEITWRTKELVSLIKKIKKKSLNRNYSYGDINDKLGIRVVCSFNDELSKIDKVINENFVVINRDIKLESLEYNTLGYTSNHYDVLLEEEEYGSYVFEIQARTLNQDVWAKIAHKLSYKNNLELPPSSNRAIHRLLAMYEIADEEFNRIYYNYLTRNNDIKHVLLNILEKYTFTLAQSDYDKDISDFYFGNIVGFFDIPTQQQIKDRIEDYLIKREGQIHAIFNNNADSVSEFSWMLTQPEVFLIWYCIENHFYVIRDNWLEHLDIDEFRYLANLWGFSTNF